MFKITKNHIYKITISVIFGLIALIIDYLPLQFKISNNDFFISIGLIFPMIVTLAWGWKYGLISLVIEIISRFSNVPNNKVLLIYIPLLIIWIIYHGTAGYYYKKNKQLFLTPYIIEIPFRFFYIFIAYFASMYISKSEINSNLLYTFSTVNFTELNIIKDIFNIYFILLTADLFLNFKFVNKIFNIEKSINESKLIIIITVSISILFWVMDSLFDFLYLYKQNYLDILISNNIPILENHKKILILIIIIISGIIISLLIQKHNQSKNKYRNILEYMYDGFAVMDKSGILTYVNGSLCKILGYNKNELLKNNILNFLDDENKNILLNQIKLRRLGEIQPYEIIFTKKDNSTVTTLISPQLVFDDNNRYVESFAVIRDISGIKLSEQRLMESEEKFRHIAEQSPSMIIIYNSNNILYANNRFLEIMGYTTNEVLLKEFSVYNILTPEFKEISKTNISRRLNGEILNPVEYKLLTKQGFELNVIVNAKMMIYKNEKVLIGVFTDITDIKKAEKELKESEEKFRVLAEKSPNIITINTENKILYVNNMFEELLGYTKNDVYSTSFNMLKLFPNELYKQYKDNYRKRFIKDSGIESTEYKLIGKKGKPIHVILSSQHITYNNIDAIITVATNITDRKKIESELKESEEKFKILAEESPNVIFINKKGKIVYINKKCEDLLGYKKEEIYSPDFKFNCLFTKESAELIKKNTELIKNTLYIPSTNYTAITKFGKKIETVVSTKLINYEGEQAILGIVTDITDFINLLNDLKNSEERYKTITSSITDYIYRVLISNNQVTKTTHGPACTAITGYTPEEFNNNKYLWIQMVYDEDQKLVEEQVTKLLKGEKVSPVEHRIIHKNGSIRWIKNSIVPFYDNENRLIAYDGIIYDITDIKNTEIEKENLNDALINMNKELENLVYVTSHDLRSPLINIQGFSKELDKSMKDLITLYNESDDKILDKTKIEEIINKEINQFLIYIETSVKKMDQLLNSLLKYSRVNKASFEITDINMNEMINSIIENMQYIINKQNINFIVDYLPDCRGDKSQLNQAFTNIIDNAVKYIDKTKQGNIHIYSYVNNNECIYCIKDNGVGIEPASEKRIFEIFFRSHRTEEVEGEGLGLAIVQKIINKHHGKIRFESIVNEGSTFYITLPK